MCLTLHNTHVDMKQFENVKDRQYNWLKENPFFTEEEKDKLRAFIAAAPDADTAIHGDLQFSNGIFVDKDGKREKYFIDLGDFCYGYPMFDLGMVYLCCKLNDESWTMEQYHMSNATAARFWDAFADAYFHSPDCPIEGCGPDADLTEIEKTVRVYAGLKTLLIESCTHCPMPEFRAVLKENILK
jgi:thiamine kinase-like enzyme